MAFAIVIHGTERSLLESSAPTTASIVEAFRYAERGVYTVDGVPHSRTAINGGWVGPAPRVTRSAPLGAFVTQAAWVWLLTNEQQAASGLQSSADLQAFAQRLADDVHTSLRAGASPNTMGDFWTMTTAPFNEAVNGPMSWWQSGEATRATFVNDFPTLAQRTLPADNPVGPTPQRAETGAGDALKHLSWIVVGGAVVYGLVTFGPALATWLPTKSKPAHAGTAVQNPRRKRR